MNPGSSYTIKVKHSLVLFLMYCLTSHPSLFFSRSQIDLTEFSVSSSNERDDFYVLGTYLESSMQVHMAQYLLTKVLKFFPGSLEQRMVVASANLRIPLEIAVLLTVDCHCHLSFQVPHRPSNHLESLFAAFPEVSACRSGSCD